MEELVPKIHRLLLKKSLTLAIAESCTGGMLSKMLTDLPGSSRYFILGAVTYSNRAKKEILKVPESLLDRYGAVSSQVATLMAKQVRKIARTDLGIGISGIAGPEGGTADKPIGTVFIAVSAKNHALCRKFLFSGNRATVRRNSCRKALELLGDQCALLSP